MAARNSRSASSREVLTRLSLGELVCELALVLLGLLVVLLVSCRLKTARSCL